jgi:F0F1-type ATP synthase assembly protein I
MGLLQRGLPTNQQKQVEVQQWKAKVLAFAAATGTVFGLLAGYMYSRAAEEDVSSLGKAERISTGEILGLGLALLAVIRQITELAKGPEQPRKR